MRNLSLLAFLAPILVSTAAAQTIVQGRGVDPRVDYASLTRFGPWDDRNYRLTQADLELLAPNETELDNHIPAFYRVELRRRLELPRSGPVQYPFSDLPSFFNRYGGYLVDGKLYRTARRRDDGRFEIVFEEAVDRGEFLEHPEGVFSGEARVTDPNGAAESAVAISPADPDLVIAGTNGPAGSQRMHFSTDGGESWTQVELPLGGACCDPTVAWSSDGSFSYAATLAGSLNGVWFYRSSNGGQTWDDLASEPGNDPRREIGGGSDKEYLHVDLSPTSPYRDQVYLTWHQGNVLRFALSTDHGHTWSTPLVFNSDPLGIASDITSDAAGNIYYSWAAFQTQTIVVKKSTDGGASFAPAVTVDTTKASFHFPIPSQETRQVAIITCLDTDRSGGPFAGSVYLAWSDITAPAQGTPSLNHAQVKVAYSRDGGATWATTIPHETGDVDLVDRWQQWLSVGPDGKVYVIFYDTRNDLTRASVDVYYSVSGDGAQTWSAPARLTSVTSPNATGGFEFGDYNGLDIAMNGLMAIFTDNRDEAGGGAQSKDIYVSGFEGQSTQIFTDGFESGDTAAWSATVP